MPNHATGAGEHSDNQSHTIFLNTFDRAVKTKNLTFSDMSSFFSKFKYSRQSKKKGGGNNAGQNGGNGGLYSSSNNSSQVTIGSRSVASSAFSSQQQNARGQNVGFVQQTTPSSAPFNQNIPYGSSSNLSSTSVSTNNNSNNTTNNRFSGVNGSQARSSQNDSSQSGPSPLFMRQPFILSALVKGRFQTIVELPKYVDQNEWLALNSFEFYGNISQFVNMSSDYIDESHIMNAGAGYDYLWIDTNKQAVRLPASRYIEFTMSWISAKFDDPTLFPTKQGVPFPPNFQGVLKSIYTQLFRIFAYIFHNHYEKSVHLSLESHFNSLFCHFASFGKNFNLLDRNEMAPLFPLIESLEAQGKIG